MLKTKKLEASQIAALAEVLPGSKLVAYIAVLQSMDIGFDVLHEIEDDGPKGTYVVIIKEGPWEQKQTVLVMPGYASEFSFSDKDGEIVFVMIGVQETFEDTDD